MSQSHHDIDEDKEEKENSQNTEYVGESYCEELADRVTGKVDKDQDIIRILVATDIHCGYGENKPVINADSTNTFEEILQIAKREHADMVLLGGDLFHENHPSREVLHRVTQLLREYCLNSAPVQLEFLSDPTVNFSQSVFDRVNYYDENLNVGLPVFTIHGNHDDLSGKGLTALDLLHEAGLINLFGKHEDISKFDVAPLLLKKGETRLALYGIGSQRDDRLVRAFKDDSIRFLRPQTGAEDWFNLLTLHQNRPRRSVHRTTGSYMPESLIPTFFDLVVWGHEHECKPQPQYVASSEAVGDGFFILQPGSSVATSLTEDEAVQKQVFLIKIKGRKFISTPIPLETTRQIVVDELELGTLPPGTKVSDKNKRPITKEGEYIDELAIESKVNEMLAKAKMSRRPRQPLPPLLRLKVVYVDDWVNVPMANGKRIGVRYEGVVANCTDMIIVKKKIERERKKKSTEFKRVQDEKLGNVSASNLQYIINDYFAKQPMSEKLTVLKPSDIGNAIEAFAGSEEGAPKAKLVNDFEKSLQRSVDLVKTKLQLMAIPEISFNKKGEIDFESFENTIASDIKTLKEEYYKKLCEGIIEEEEEMIPTRSNYEESMTLGSDDDDDDDIEEIPPPPSARGRGRGRGRAATRSARGTRSKQTTLF
ncbi:unnamed protein product [Caenorhabditis bovis]|uniref:Double-strand break repair protein n=1 Tax=Caenorhabditis bovis TaxID=2654633 RepID=A0A8S1F2F0_9PELO|nr:unnamed protein product [Caenorhabditis bovis]